MEAAIITGICYVIAAILAGLYGKRTYNVVRGNGHGNVTHLVEKLAEHVDERFTRIEEHLDEQDKAIYETKGRVDTWEKAGFNVPHSRD